MRRRNKKRGMGEKKEQGNRERGEGKEDWRDWETGRGREDKGTTGEGRGMRGGGEGRGEIKRR